MKKLPTTELKTSVGELNKTFTKLVQKLFRHYLQDGNCISYNNKLEYIENDFSNLKSQLDNFCLLDKYHYYFDNVNEKGEKGVLVLSPSKHIILSSIEWTIFNSVLYNINLNSIDEVNLLLKSFIEKDNSAFYDTIDLKIKKSIIELTGNIDFDFFNSLSMTNYETRPCLGTFLICYDCPLDKLEVCFELDTNKDLDFLPNSTNLKFYRKLLELTDDETALVITDMSTDEVNQPYAVGIAKKSRIEKATTVHIKKDSSWYISSSSHDSLKCEKGRFYYVEDESQESFENIEVIESFVNDKTGTIKKFINKIKEKSNFHGALLIFWGNDDKKRIDELCSKKRGIRLNNKNLQDLSVLEEKHHETLINLCKIDGALVFDKKGYLISIGTVLDGIVKSDGSRARGARYNSTLAFLDYYSKDFEIKAIVISEDKYVTILPRS